MVLPRMLLLPTCLAEIVYGWTTKGYTCIQGYEALCELFPIEEKFRSIKDWLLAASQAGTGDDSQLRLPVVATDEAEEQFQTWCEEVITQRQGSPTASTPTTPAQPALPTGVDPSTSATMAFLAQMQQQSQQNTMMLVQQLGQMQSQNTVQTAAMLNQVQHGLGGAATATAKGAGTVTHSKDGWARIFSLCNVNKKDDLAAWWYLTAGKKKDDIEDFWIQGKRAMEVWAQQEGLVLHKAYEPEPDVLKAWFNADFRPRTDYYSEAHKGLTPYAGMPLSRIEKQRRQTAKKAEEASAHNRTLSEAAQIETEKWEPPSPPADYDTLVKTLTVFTGIVWLLFGYKADLYLKLRRLLKTLMSEDAEQNAQRYFGVRARQIFWLVIVDAKRYCRQALTADQMHAGHPFPESSLHLYDIQVQNAAEINIMEFPEKWKAMPQLALQPHKEPSAGMWPYLAAPTAGAGLPPLWQGQYQGGQQPNQQGWGKQPVDADSQYQGELPPDLIDALRRVSLVDSKAKLLHFIRAAGVEPKDLPKIRGEKTCFNHLMGKCRTKTCINKHFFAPLQFQELEKWTQIMVKGAEKICADGKLPNLKKRKKQTE